MELVKAKVALLALSSLLLAGCRATTEPVFTWQSLEIDGHRTGVTSPSADNVPEAMGRMEGKVYKAPNGQSFKGGATPEAAALMLAAQPSMARLKEVIAISARNMDKHRPESELSNMAVDIVMQETERLTGRKVDVGVINFGGIRTSMPKGPVLLDDIVSMFPFKNYLTYVALPGYELRRIFEYMADGNLQAVGGVKLVIRDRKLVSALVGGKPISDSKTYGLATIDFLLDGGDGLKLARGCKELIITECKVVDAVEPYIRAVTARGDTLDYAMDGRVVIEKTEKK